MPRGTLWYGTAVAASLVLCVGWQPVEATGSIRSDLLALRGKVVHVTFVGGGRLNYDHGVGCVGTTIVTLEPFGDNNADPNEVFASIGAIRSVVRAHPTDDEQRTEALDAREPAPATCRITSLHAALADVQFIPFVVGLTSGETLHAVALRGLTATDATLQLADRPATTVVPFDRIAFVQGERAAK